MKNLWKAVLAALCALALTTPACAEDGSARVMPEPYASATHADPALIPYPDNRDENGFLEAGSVVTSYEVHWINQESGELATNLYPTEGEFVYEDTAHGLWAYLSPTLQVQIVRYDGHWTIAKDGKDYDQRWFVADVKYDTTAESFEQHNWYLEDETGAKIRGRQKDQQMYPQTIAQADRLVLAVNGDYYHNRTKKKPYTTGNIARQGRVIYDITGTSAYPNLDCAAFFPDGRMAVYDARETTATALVEQGARDVVSFGPWLVRNGELRIYDGKNNIQPEPRLAIGMVEPGHLIIIDCEGRVPSPKKNKKSDHEAKGLSLVELAELMYYHGANEAINMDGGNTSVLIFMGEKLNDTGHDTYISSPRNQEELFGIGMSELVHTEWINGKPGK